MPHWSSSVQVLPLFEKHIFLSGQQFFSEGHSDTVGFTGTLVNEGHTGNKISPRWYSVVMSFSIKVTGATVALEGLVPAWVCTATNLLF